MGQPPGRLPSALPSHYNSRVPGKSLETLAEGGWGRSPCTVPGLGRTRSHDGRARRDPRSFPATAAPSGSQQTLTPFSLPSALGLGALLTAGVGPSSEYPGQGPARAPPGIPAAQGLPRPGGVGGSIRAEGRGRRKEGGQRGGGPSCPQVAMATRAQGQLKGVRGGPPPTARKGTAEGHSAQRALGTEKLQQPFIRKLKQG